MAIEKARTRSRPDGTPVRTQDPEGTRQNIIEIASEEFALNGLSGARIDEIAARTRASKRMIYYYFGDKEGLYLSALENAYRLVREGEAKLDIDGLPALEALKALVEFTFDHHHQHEAFIRMVMIENIHHGQYLERSTAIRQLNVTAIGTIETLYARGLKAGVFRKGIDPIELHWQISALCFFNVSNRATFSKLFGRDIGFAQGAGVAAPERRRHGAALRGEADTSKRMSVRNWRKADLGDRPQNVPIKAEGRAPLCLSGRPMAFIFNWSMRKLDRSTRPERMFSCAAICCTAAYFACCRHLEGDKRKLLQFMINSGAAGQD